MTGKLAFSKAPYGLLPTTRLRFEMLLALILVASCSPNSGSPTIDARVSDEEGARQSLIRFFHDLNVGNYDAAQDLYGGPYETMVDQNPGIDPHDHAALFEAACRINGAQCLEIRSVQLDSTGVETGSLYTFMVEFNQPGGSLFSLGPCCGRTPDGTVSQTQFRYEVRKTAEHWFRVMTPPVYLP